MSHSHSNSHANANPSSAANPPYPLRAPDHGHAHYSGPSAAASSLPTATATHLPYAHHQQQQQQQQHQQHPQYHHQNQQNQQNHQYNMASSYHHAAQAVHSYNNHPPPSHPTVNSDPDIPTHATGGSSSSASASTSIKRRRPYYEVQQVHDPNTGRSREVIVIDDGDSGEPPPHYQQQQQQQQHQLHSPYASPGQHSVHLPSATTAADASTVQQQQAAAAAAANARPKRQLRPRAGQANQQQQVLDSPSQHPQLLSAALASTIGYSNGSGSASGAGAVPADPAYVAPPATKRRRRDEPAAPTATAPSAAVTRHQHQPYSLYNTTTAPTNANAAPAPLPAAPIAVPPPPISSSTSKAAASNVAHPPYDDKDGHYIVTSGDVLQNTYSVLRQLGQGTFGKVAECIDLRHNRRVAVKIVRAIQKYHDAALGEIRVLNALRKSDPDNRHQCIQLLTDFDYRKHKCMVFPLLGPSLFDFLKDNQFQPFTLAQVREIAIQLIDSVAYLHRLKIVHTDLKPENILLLSADSITWTPLTQHFNMSRKVQAKPCSSQKILKSLHIKVIDFGSATFDNEYKSSVVSTRHYRAPEIMLELGWSFACDMWSVGCILVELLIGEALFQTHENIEHLAMMEMILGMFQDELVQRSRRKHSWFHQPEIVAGGPSGQVKVCKVHFPLPDTKRDAKTFVKSLKTLKDICEMQGRSRANANVVIVDPAQAPAGLPASTASSPTSSSSSASNHPPYIPPPSHSAASFSHFHSLVQRLLIFDPRHRLTAKHALQHPFFEHIAHPLSRLPQSALVSGHQHQHQHLQQQQQQQRMSPVARYPSSTSTGVYGAYTHAQQFAQQHQHHHSSSPATSLGPPQPQPPRASMMAVGGPTSGYPARHHHLAAPIGPGGQQPYGGGGYAAYAPGPAPIGPPHVGPYAGPSTRATGSSGGYPPAGGPPSAYYDATAEARRAHLQQQLAMETGFALDEDDAPSALSTDSYGTAAPLPPAPPGYGGNMGHYQQQQQPQSQHLYNQAMVHAAAAAAVMQQHHGAPAPAPSSSTSSGYYQQHPPQPAPAPAGPASGYYSPHHRPASAFASLPSSAVASPLLIGHGGSALAPPPHTVPSSAISPRSAQYAAATADPGAHLHHQASYMYSSAAAAAAAAAAYANAGGYSANPSGGGYDYGGGAPGESMRYSVSSLGAVSGGAGSDLGTAPGGGAGARGYYQQPQQGQQGQGYAADGYQQQQYRGYM